MKFINLLVLGCLILAGCSDGVNITPVVCTDIWKQSSCVSAALSGSGCYWTADNTCVAAITCDQPKRENSCISTSDLIAGTSTACTWSGTSCYLKVVLPCKDFTQKNQCESTSGSDGNCYWKSNNTCSYAKTCTDLGYEALCTGATVASKACAWTPNADTCPGCTLSKVAKACCVTPDNSCTTTDTNCTYVATAGKCANSL